MAQDDSISQEDLDELLNLSDDADGGGDDEELNLDSLLSDDASQSVSAGSSGGSIDQETLDALAGVVGMQPDTSSRTAAPKKSAPRSNSNNENMDLLLDVFVRFTVELGRTTMLIKDVLMLGEGSVVELDKAVGDEVDILVNDRLFGRGKLVVIDEYFGIQITHILDPLERFRNL